MAAPRRRSRIDRSRWCLYGEDGQGLIGQFQRNEYTRYSLQIRSRHGRCSCSQGRPRCSADALLDVAAARGVFIPGDTGNVPRHGCINGGQRTHPGAEVTGATMVSLIECMVTTEIMPTWRDLWTQRKRWQRGALENLSAYGITRATIRYWGQGRNWIRNGCN